MTNSFLPKHIEKVGVPPIKCQGIKTKLVNFIAENIFWEGKGKWIEPFLGSGSLLFNIHPNRALVTDTNKYIITLYKEIQSGKLNAHIISNYLEDMGYKLFKHGKEFFYEVRSKFNREGGSLELLFLNRSCFNGIMRFNRKGEYNVPFGHKLERFRKSYVTKIVNQVKWVSKIMKDRDWSFEVSGWRETLEKGEPEDFVYLDPPYIGRHTDYYNSWTINEAVELANVVKSLPSGFALSMWLENKYRRNSYIDEYWREYVVKTFKHYYHVGSKESFRNEMEEALIIKPNSFPQPSNNTKDMKNKSIKRLQVELFT